MPRPQIQSSVMLQLVGKDITRQVLKSQMTTAAQDDAAVMAALRRDYRRWELSLSRLRIHVVWKRR